MVPIMSGYLLSIQDHLKPESTLSFQFYLFILSHFIPWQTYNSLVLGNALKIFHFQT